MSFIHISGPALTEEFNKTASVAIAANSLVGFNVTSGYVDQAAVATTRIAGVAIKKIASTDTDYADNSGYVVVVPTSEDVFEATVSGTATQANVGKRYDLTSVSAGTAQAVNLSGTTYGVVTVVKFLSASKVYVKINGAYEFADVST